MHNLYLFSQAVSGIGGRLSGNEKRKRLPFIWVKKRDRGEPTSFSIKVPKLLLHKALKSIQDT